MATNPIYRDMGRPNLTLEQLLQLEPLFDSRQINTGESTEFVRNSNPYAYAQQSPDYQSLALYDPQGNYLGDDARNHQSGDKNLMKFLLASAAGYLGSQYLMGGDTALGGSGLEAAGAGGAGAEAAASPAAFDFSGMALGDGGYGALTGGFTGVPGAGGAQIAGALTGGGSAMPGAGSMFGGDTLSTLGRLGMGVLGAASNRDQTSTNSQTNTREPWAPAQPLLQSLIGSTQKLADQYSAQPFTPAQQTAYNNLGGLLNTINSGAPGLLGGAMANASGANNYDRTNPRRQLTGSSFDMSQFAPGLLNFFPRQG